MDLSKEWYWSEFVNQEMLEQHRVIETEYTFYDAIANGNIEYVQDNCINQTFTNPDGMGKLSDDKLQNIQLSLCCHDRHDHKILCACRNGTGTGIQSQ